MTDDKPARLNILRDGMLLRMLGFGFFSGLPLPLSIFTLQQWFTTSGISVHAVTRTAWLGLPYTLEFAWAPLFDRAPPGWVRRLGARRVGRRRFWLLAIQPALVLACVALALTDPAHDAALTALAAGAVALCSASQDIVINAWRIETFPQARQGVALAAYIWGYRTAMFVSGAGAIALSVAVGWHVALLGVAALLALAPLLTLASPEPVLPHAPPRPPGVLAALRQSFAAPLMEFLRRRRAAEILALVILFRLGKVFADNTAASYYHQALGFSSLVVAKANFVPSLAGTYAGAAFGGWLVVRLGTMRALLLTGSVQALSLGLYLALLAFTTPWMLYAKVGGEYFAGGAADAVFLAFISSLCAREYTATQYALLASLAAIALHSISGVAGDAVVALGWSRFYVATMLGGIPALLLALHLRRYFQDGETSAAPGNPRLIPET
jgi:PAT family beta-lactamase induction signal transducer AmpG